MKIALVTTLPTLSENDRLKKEAQNLGHDFSIVDMQEFGFEINEGNLRVTQLENLDAEIVIVRGIFLAIKTISVIINSLRKKGIKIFDNNFLEHRYSIDKVTDIVKLASSGISVPDTYYSRDFKTYSAIAQKLGYPFVMKSSRMGKGADVLLVESVNKLKGIVSDKQNEGKSAKSYLLQQYIPYQYDLRVLVVGDEVFTMRRIPAEGEFRANFSLGGKVELYELDEESKKLALNALAAVDMSVGGVDILITKDKRKYVLEVNHTAGFVGMEKATGKNSAKVYLNHAISSAK